MSDNFSAGVLAGFILALVFYPVAVIIGAASVPFHRHSDSRSATAGVLFAFRWTLYLTLVSIGLALWGLGMVVETAAVGGLTLILILLALGYTLIFK